MEPSASVRDKDFNAFTFQNGRWHRLVLQAYGGQNVPPLSYTATYGEALAIPAGTETVVLSKAVSGDFLDASKISCSTDSVGIFLIYVDNELIEKKRIYFTKYNTEFDLGAFRISQGSVIEVRYIHSRPSVADANATIKGVESI